MIAPVEVSASSRRNRLATAVLVALAVALAVVVLSGTGSATAGGGRLGGDFPEFYGAGRIVAVGDAAQLYDAERQAQSQKGLFGDEDDGYLDFAYPPVVAAAYAPLSALPYRAAYLLQVAAMVAAIWLGLRLVRPMVGFVRANMALVLAGSVAFFPMFRAIGGGQNTAITFLCLAAAWRADHEERDLVAGLCLGALLYKPQLAVLVLTAQLVSRRWKVLAGTAVAAGALWVGSALTMGISWVGPFLEHGVAVPANDGQVGGGGSVSLIGTAHRVGDGLGHVLFPTAVLVSAVVAVLCLRGWRYALLGTGADLGLGYAIVAAGTVLVAPHVIFYDAGILVLAGLCALRSPTSRIISTLVVVVVVSAAGALDGLPVNPLSVLAAAALVWALRKVGDRPTADAHGRSPVLAST